MYSQAEIEMFGQLDTVRHPELGLGLLRVVTAVLMVMVIDIALAPLMTAHGIGIVLVVLFADLQVGEHLSGSPQQE